MSATTVRGTRLPRPARRQQLLDAALGVFVQHGYHAAAMDEIADVAGVSKPVLYQHFPSKLDLYLALLDVNSETLERRVRTALDSTQDNRQRVASCIRAYFDFVDDPAGAFRLVFESDLRQEPGVRDRLERSLQLSVEPLSAIIAHDTGLSEAEADLLAAGLAGLAETSARWWLASPDRLPKDRAVELLDALLWRGISGFPRVD